MLKNMQPGTTDDTYRVSADGKKWTCITEGDFDVINEVAYDEQRGYIYFTASPDHAIDRYLFRTQVMGKGKVENITKQCHGTAESGQYSYSFSPHYDYAVERFSSAERQPRYTLVKCDKRGRWQADHVLEENAEAQQTWEDLAAFAKKFNAANPGKYGFVMDVGNAYYTIVFTTANGNRLFGASGTDTTDTKINSADSVKGMQFFQKTLRPALNVPAADLSTSVADSAFASGNAAMHITGLWNVKPFVDAGVKFGVAALPALPGDNKPCASFSGTRAMFVSAYSEHQEAAAAFAEFLLTPEMQKLRFDITGAMPAINVKVDSPYMPGFIAQLDYAFPMPSIPQMGAFWDAMANASKNIWDGADVKKELDAANAAILGL